MAKVLSQEEIDALLTSVVTGKEVKTEDIQQQKKISVYDFKRPSLVSKEQMRLLENIHEAFVRKISVFLSAQLRMIIDMNLLGLDQIMYSEFVMSISSPGAIYVGSIDNPPSQFILEISPQFVILSVERLFGGQGTFQNSNRPVSIIERKIMDKIINRMSMEISRTWATVKKFRCDIERFEHNAEFVQIVAASEPVVVVSIEINVRGNTSMMNICYPYVWISDILSSPEIQERIMFGTSNVSKDARNIIKKNIQNTNIDIRAILGRANLSIRDFLNLEIGDVFTLDRMSNQDISIYAANEHIYDGVIGKKNKNFAIKISEKKDGELNEF